MTKAEMIQQIMAVLESENPEQVNQYLTPDFMLKGPFPGPLGREQFLEYIKALKRAFPDWAYHFIFIREEDGDSIRGVIQRQGTHQGDFSLPGMVTVPATGISVILPIEPIRFFFQGEMLTRLEIEDASGGGLEGILEQLGAELPRRLDGLFERQYETA